MKKISIKHILTLLGIFAFFTFVLTGYFIQKRNYPDPVQHTFSLGDTFQLGDFEITGNSVDHGTNKEICSKYGIKNSVGNISFQHDWEDVYDCIIEITITNISDVENSFPYYYAVISSLSDSNGLDPDLFHTLNPDISSTFQPNETKTVYFTYSIYNSTIQIKGDPFEKLNYSLVFQCYPDRYSILIE